MRRIVTVLTIVMVASALTACGSASTDTGAAGVPATGVAVVPAAAPAAAAAVSSDIYSPTQTVTPGEMFPTDAKTVPASVVAALSAKRPLLVLWYDPTTLVSLDQRRSVDATIREYEGSIDLVALDYTVGLASGAASATVDAESQKVELLAAALRVNTTPYILFVDRYGRITYRFAGFADRALLVCEALRAIQ
jgi:hypothetical protein